MGPSELKIICQLKDVSLIKHIFEGINGEDEAQISAMQALLNITARFKVSSDKTQLEDL